MIRRKIINPDNLPWNQASLYKTWGTRHIEVLLRPAKKDEIVDGQKCQKGDMIDITNPDDPFRIEFSELKNPFSSLSTPTQNGKIKSIDKLQGKIKRVSVTPDGLMICQIKQEYQRIVKAIQVTVSGHLPAPSTWEEHPGWNIKPGDYIIESKDGYITDPNFKEKYHRYRTPGNTPCFKI